MNTLPAIYKPANLVVVNNPFNLSDRTIQNIDASIVLSLPVFLSLYAPITLEQEYHVSVNGKVYGPGELAGLLVRPGDSIVVCPVLRGGGGRGKNPLAILAGIALSVFAFGVVGAAAKAAWGAIAGQLVAGATLMIGGQLLGSLFGPKMETEKDEQSYKWGALQPIQAQGAVIPITYGTVRTAGQTLNQRIMVQEDTQYLQLLLSGGEGPVTEIFDVRINDNEAANYQDVVLHTRLGVNDQTPIAGFGSLYNNQAVGVNLEVGKNASDKLDEKLPGEWSVREIDGDAADYLEVVLDFPEGLGFNFETKSGFGTNWVKPEFQYARQDDNGSWGGWVPWFFEEFKDATPKRFTRVRVTGKLVSGHYRVRARMFAKRAVNYPRDRTTTVWTSLTAIVDQPTAHPNKTLLGIRIKATDQLNNGVPVVTWKQRRETVLVFEDENWVVKDAQNPAWIIYDIIVKARMLSEEVHVFGEPPERIDLPMFKAWAEWNDREINNRPAMRMNLMIDESRQLWEWVSIIAASARGSVVLKGTKVSCIWDQPSDPVQLFTMGNIQAGSFSGEYLPLESRANAVEISFLNEAKNYEREQITVYTDGYDGQDTSNPVAVQLTGITDFERAYREGLYRLNQNKYILRTVTFTASADAIACQVGDVILVQHDQWGQGGRILEVSGFNLKLDHAVKLTPGVSYQIMVRRQDDSRVTGSVQNPDTGIETDEISVSGLNDINPYDIFTLGSAGKVAKPFRVQQMSRDKDLSITLTCTEYIAELYTEAGVIPVVDYAEGAAVIANLVLTPNGYYNSSGSWVPELWAYWSYRGQKPIAYDVEWKYDGGLWGSRIQRIETAVQCPLRDLTAMYGVRVRGVYDRLPPTDWAYATFESENLGTGIAPGPPTNLQVAGWFGFAQLSWENPDNLDLAYIEIWEADEDDRSKAAQIGQTAAPANGYTRLIASGGTKWYWTRAVNHTEQRSDFNRPEGTPCVIAPGSHEEYMDELLQKNPYLAETIENLGERIEPLEIGLELIQNTAERIGDAEADIHGRLAPAIERVASGVTRLANETSRTRDVFRWAGVEVNEEEGTVVIRAVEDLKTETGYQFSDVAQRFDAQAAAINLKATRTYVDELAASLISSIVVAQEWRFNGDLNGWTAQNATLTAQPTNIKYSTTAANPSLTSPDVALAGAVNNIISFQLRQNAGAAQVKCRVQYKTAGHGYSDDYMKRVDILGSASIFRSVQVDMHSLTAGNDDWQTSTINGIRICLGETVGEEYDISLVNVGQSSFTDVALRDLEMRITQAEIDIDGANAAIALKADHLTIQGLTQQLSSAEADIDGLKSAITLKAERTELTPLMNKIESAEIKIDALSGSITQQLSDFMETQGQIDDLAEASLNNSVSEADENEKRRLGIAAAKQELYAEVVSANEAAAGYKTELTAIINQNTARFNNAINAIATDLSAEVNQREVLAVGVSGNTAAIQNEASVRATADGSLSQRSSTLESKVGSSENAANANGSLYARLKAEATTRANKDGTLEAKFGVRLDVNGRITGFVQNNDGKQGNFVIMADKFAVVPVGSSSSAGTLLFDTQAGSLHLKNIYVDGAWIKNASVGTLTLASRTVTIPEGIAGSCYSTGYSTVWKRLLYADKSTPVQLIMTGLEKGQPIWLEFSCMAYLRKANVYIAVVPSAMSPGHPLAGGVTAPVCAVGVRYEETEGLTNIAASGKFTPSASGNETFSVWWMTPGFYMVEGVVITNVYIRAFSLLGLQCKR
jgi:predicted phage tail protein